MTVDRPTIDAAIAAVTAAADLTTSAQGRLLAGDTLTKTDDSPVTVADFGAQAVVCAVLTDSLGEIEMVGEEDANDLVDDRSGLLDGVAGLVSSTLARDVSPATLLDWIAVGSGSASADRYWTLDPIDGTKGFLRGDQYAIALALIEHGEVVLGVLGCPNYPLTSGARGATFVAAHGETHLLAAGERTQVNVVPPASLDVARFCESVESGHSDQGQSAQIAEQLGMTAEPYRIDSQCKYGAIALSDANVYLRLPTRADYVEKIWDHAAGKLVVENAGGRVTDVHGAPLDFARGARLSANSGVIATSGRFHDEVVAAVGNVLS
ncbi:MAG: 3'(2'),5'-bisphosphate nucleotidase [Ilumatobacteraceae bacterium]|nr:3'(2'),5'-bisphosphate nucleotidase [Ilumatobacteraceae bacterium]